jgi:hypothetical protein
MNDAPLIRWVGMFENVSKTGQQYFVGYAGGLKLVLLRNSKAGEGEPGWNLCVTARPEKSGTAIAKPAAEAKYPQYRNAQPRPAVDPALDDPLPEF